MYTVLELKRSVARQLGKRTAAVANTIRDESILDAVRQYVAEHPWSWNEKTWPITIASGQASLPTDLSLKFDTKLYTYSAQTKYTFTKVSIDELSRYDSSEYAYAIDPVNSLIKCCQTTASLTLAGQKLPQDIALDASDDTDTLPFPDLTAPSRLAVGLYWLAAERDEDAFDRFVTGQYKPLLKRDIKADTASTDPIRPGTVIGRMNLGWNNRGGNSGF